MKKVLIVLGMAMCTTLAMAQTNKVTGKICTPTPAHEKVALQMPKASVDYKASIFTKDGEDVVLGNFDFSNTTMFTVGVVNSSDVINDTVVGSINCHNRTEPSTRWHRIADSAYTTTDQFAEDYAEFIDMLTLNNLHAYMGPRNGIEEDNGFMILSPSEAGTNANVINTYFTLNPVALNGNSLVDVTWRQYYAKYYDLNYLDYQLNGNWYAIEINVTGIDADINTIGLAYNTVTLPLAATNQTNLSIRFRFYSNNTNYYGYGWAIDDVKVIAPANSDYRWSFNSEGYIQGFYGTMPQGMQVPMCYAVFSRNIGVNNLSGASLNVHHRDAVNSDWAPVFSVPQTGVTMTSGDPYHDYLFEINESGLMYAGGGARDYVGYHSFPEYYGQYYRNTDAQLADAGFQRRALPSTNAGLNQFYLIASNAQDLNDTIAAYSYTVSEELEEDAEFGRTVPGYRWGNDNGIVPGGSEFRYGFASNNLITDDCGHQYDDGYSVMTRLNTPSAIPTDEHGNPWVIRGMELVSSTKVTAADAIGARFKVNMYRYEMNPGQDTGWYYWMRNYTGLSGQEVYLVGEGNVAPTTDELEGYATAENGNYYACNVFFPEQPALEPNTSFWLEFELNGGGNYGIASQAWRYCTDATDFSVNDNYTRYRNDEQLAPYANQFTPSNKPYDAFAYDPTGSSPSGSHSVSGWNIEEYPLMRLIVGPKMVLDTHYVSANCTEDAEENLNYWVYSYSNDRIVCGTPDSVVEGAVYSYLILPGDPIEEGRDRMEESDDGETAYYVFSNDMDHRPSKVIDAIYVNGEAIDLNDESVVSPIDYTVYWAGHTPLAEAQNRWDPALVRSYYMITLRNITEDVTITADVHDVELNIRDIEDNVNLLLAPNPATSQVRLNVSDFSGKAKCSIIDMSGRVVYNADITSGETVINLNGVPAGAYFVRVTNDTFSKVEKLIVR